MKASKFDGHVPQRLASKAQSPTLALSSDSALDTPSVCHDFSPNFHPEIVHVAIPKYGPKRSSTHPEIPDESPEQATDQSTKASISLAGSTAIVSEFFSYAVNSILFQRAIYPPEDFKVVKKYGLNMLVTSDEGLRNYLAGIIKQIESWLLAGKVSRLVLAVLSAETREARERWQFDIHLEKDDAAAATAAGENATPGEAGEAQKKAKAKPKPQKTEKDIQTEIQGIIRQVTASVTFLPVLSEKCVFTILIYADKDTEVSGEWKDSDAHLIEGGAEQVKLRSFSTTVHKVEAMVAYRLNDD